MRGARQAHFELCADIVDLAFDGVACDGALGPSFGDHGAKPNFLGLKKGGAVRVFVRGQGLGFGQVKTVQSEVRGVRNHAACKGCLKLRAGFQTLHTTAESWDCSAAKPLWGWAHAAALA